jgi:hypothetical protein
VLGPLSPPPPRPHPSSLIPTGHTRFRASNEPPYRLKGALSQLGSWCYPGARRLQLLRIPLPASVRGFGPSRMLLL